MSLLDCDLHEQQGHSRHLVYALNTSGTSLCVLCFLTSIRDDTVLATRRSYVVREFTELVAPGGPHVGLLHDMCCKHSSLLVEHVLAALALAAWDGGLVDALLNLSTCMAGAVAFMPEMLAERALQLVSEPHLWPPSGNDISHSTLDAGSKPSMFGPLRLLEQLCAEYEAPRVQAAAALTSSQAVVELVVGGLRSGMEALTGPLLSLCSSLMEAGGSMHARLSDDISRRLFVEVLQMLPDMQDAGARLACLQLLQSLAATGCCAIEHMSDMLQDGGVDAGHCLKPCLLDSESQLQLAACQLLTGIASRAPPAVTRQLIKADVCEYVFEVLRGTLAGAGPAVQVGSSASVGSAGGVSSVQLAVEAREVLQSAAVTALHYLAMEGTAFLHHLHYGLETSTALLDTATASNNTPLQADTLALLAVLTAGPEQQQPAREQHQHQQRQQVQGASLPSALVQQLAVALVAVLPERRQDADTAALPAEWRASQEQLASYVSVCRLMTWLCQCWAHPNAARWQALQPSIWAAIMRAMQAVSLLSAEDLLATGLLAEACQLLTVAAQCLLTLSPQLLQQHQQPQPEQHLGQASGAREAGPLAHKRRPGAGGRALAQQHTPSECMLQLLDICNGQLLPVMLQVCNASSGGADRLAAVAAAVPCLQVLLQAGSLGGEMPDVVTAFAQQLLHSFRWSSFTFELLALQPSTLLSGQLWHVLLLAVALLDRMGFLQGCELDLDQLADKLAKRITNPEQLLQELCASTAGTNTSHRSGGIRRFCGVTDKQRALLLVLCVSLDAGDACWQLEDELAALEAAVVQAGPGLLNQPEMLLKMTELYVLTAQSLQATTGQLLPTPAGIVHALSRLAPLPVLPMDSQVAVWIVQRAADMPGLTSALLQAWLLGAGQHSNAAAAGAIWSGDSICDNQAADVAAMLASSPAATVVLLGMVRQGQQDTALVAAALAAVAEAVQLAPLLAPLLVQQERVCELIRRLLMGHCSAAGTAAARLVRSACLRLLQALVMAADSGDSTLEVLLNSVPHQVQQVAVDLMETDDAAQGATTQLTLFNIASALLFKAMTAHLDPGLCHSFAGNSDMAAIATQVMSAEGTSSVSRRQMLLAGVQWMQYQTLCNKQQQLASGTGRGEVCSVQQAAQSQGGVAGMPLRQLLVLLARSSGALRVLLLHSLQLQLQADLSSSSVEHAAASGNRRGAGEEATALLSMLQSAAADSNPALVREAAQACLATALLAPVNVAWSSSTGPHVWLASGWMQQLMQQSLRRVCGSFQTGASSQGSHAQLQHAPGRASWFGDALLLLALMLSAGSGAGSKQQQHSVPVWLTGGLKEAIEQQQLMAVLCAAIGGAMQGEAATGAEALSEDAAACAAVSVALLHALLEAGLLKEHLPRLQDMLLQQQWQVQVLAQQQLQQQSQHVQQEINDVEGTEVQQQEPAKVTARKVEMVDGVAIGLLRPQALLALHVPSQAGSWLCRLQQVAGRALHVALERVQEHMASKAD